MTTSFAPLPPLLRVMSVLATRLLLLVSFFLVARAARATPEAHILRIDPRAGLNEAKPVLTTVVEVVEVKRLSDVLQPCAGLGRAALWGCWSNQLEKPGALWQSFPFPEQNVRFLVNVSGEDRVARFADKTQWASAQGKPTVGTAWLVAVDAAASMRDRFGDARAIAHEFIKQMQAHDLMDLMFFDDLEVVGDTQWMTFDQRADIESKLNEVTATAPSHRGHGALFSEIKSMTKRAFTSLWTSEPTDAIPLHQAMVLLSNGAGAADPQNDVANAEIFRPYLDQGRFSEDDASLPKTPLPVISIWLPDEAPIAENTEGHNDARLMQALANPEIGGFFDVVQRGSGTAKASPIVGLVRARFNAMWLVHWRASCIGPSAEQSFNLVFENTQPPISPDPTFKNVAIGIDPGQWPLDVDRGRTMKAAQDSPVYPGGEVTIFGDFCWSGDRQRAEGYFVPTARLPVTGLTSPTTPDVAKRALQRLQATSVLGTTLATGDTYVTFSVPNDERVLDPRVDARVARLFVYDRKTHQASAIDPTGMLTLQGARTPLARLLIAGLIGLLVVAVLLVVLLLRVAGWGRKTIGEAAGTGPREYDAALAATAAAGAATIRGSAGQFAVHLGSELRVGRDPTQCPIFLSEPRVSGIHATLRFEGGHLLVRDENSNNGTWLHGARIAPGVWTLVPAGTSLRFGPLEFLVQFEA